MPLCKITPQATNRFCCLVIGQAGTGKTSLMRTIMGQEYDQESREWKQSREPTEKVLTLSAESGLLCVRDLVEQGMVEGYEIGSLQDFREAQAMLMTPEFRERYGWIFIDSLTEISSRCVEAMRMKHQSGSDTFKMWGEYNDAMTLLIKAFRDMRDYNVVFTCLESADTDDNRRRFLAPAISGSQLKERLTSYFDEVFHMTETASEDGSVWRVFHTAHPVGLAKDRSGRLSPVEPPNLLHIKNKILA